MVYIRMLIENLNLDYIQIKIQQIKKVNIAAAVGGLLVHRCGCCGEVNCCACG